MSIPELLSGVAIDNPDQRFGGIDEVNNVSSIEFTGFYLF
jgi:hypothetical protein